MTLFVQAYRDASGFDALAGVWNDLLHRSSADTLFLTHQFQRIWWRLLGEGELLLLAVQEEGGDVVGLAPLFVTETDQGERVLSIVGCEEVADYLDLIVAEGWEEEVCEVLVEYLTGPDGPAWDLLDLCNLHQDSPTLRLLPALAEARGWDVSIDLDDVCPIVRLPGTWEAYLEMLDGKQRREIRRKLRRVGTDVTWYVVGPEHDLMTEIEDFLSLMADSDPDKAEFLTPRMRDFFRQLARATYEAGWLQLMVLLVRDQKAAAYVNFVYDNRVLVYNSGFDWQSFPRLGAGIILTAYAIRHAIEQGWDEFDFMRGDERYKYQFGGQDVEVRRLSIRKT